MTKQESEQSRAWFASVVVEATTEGSMHLHGILGALIGELKEMQRKLVECPASKVTAVDRLHACSLSDFLVESLIEDLPVDPEHLVATADPEDSLRSDCDRAIECVKRGLLLTVKGFHNHASPLIRA
jgi:hypothetical protein